MKTRHRWLTFVLPSLLLSTSLLASNMALAPGDSAPPLRGDTPAGDRKVVMYEQNEVTLVNFWASWCQPCLQEMPALEALHQKLSGSGVEIVGVMKDSITREEFQQFIDTVGVTYPVLYPIRRVGKDWRGVSSLPTSFLIDGRGTIRRRYVGATAEQTEGLVYDVEALLNGRPLGPFIFPDESNAVTEEDRLRLKKERARRQQP